ncbi:hypothetical protein M8J77_011278 [Diaphorina citri]|nr:hypothetical protein M8J77_011278 [Diaphorina citri]
MSHLTGNIQAKVETFVRQFRTDNVRTKLSSLKQFLSIDRKSVHSSNPDVRQSSLTESSKNISSTNQTTITARAADAQYNPSTSHPLCDTIIAELDPKNPCGSLESSASDSSKGLDEINPNTNSTKSDARKGLNAEINPPTDPNCKSDASKVGLDAGINRECDTSKTVVRDSETKPNTEKIVGISATGNNPALETNRSNVRKIVGLTDLESKPSIKEVNKTIGTDAQPRPINSETKLSSDKNRLEKSQELSKTASNTEISQDKPNLGETNKHIANKTIDTFEELDIKPSAIFGVTSKDTPKPLVNSNRFLSVTSEDNLNSEFVVKDELNGCDTDEDDLKRLKSFVRNLSDKYRNFELSSTNTQSYSPSIESSPFNIELASPNIERSPFNIELVSQNIELSRAIELSHPTRFDFLLNLANIREFDSREGLEILDTVVRLSIGFVDGLIRTAEEKVESDQKLESCSDLEGEAFKETHPQIGVHRESESAFGAKVFEEGTPFDSGFRRKSRDSAERILERSGLESRASNFHTERAANFKGNKFKLEEKKEEDPFESLYHEKLCDSERGLFTERQCIREANHETNEWTHEDDANEEIDSNEDLANENLDKAVSELNDFPVFALETGESHQFAPVEKNLNESGSGGVKASLKRAQFRSLDEFSLKFTRSLLNDWKNPLKRVFQRIQSEDSARGPLESSLVIGETTGLDQLESAGDSDGKGLNAERISADTNEPAHFETCAHERLTSKVDCSSDSSDNLANKAHSSHEFRAGIELESNITHKTAYGGIDQTHCSKSDLNAYTSGEHFAPNVHQELGEAGSPFATIVGKKGSESAPLESVTSQATTNVSENQSRIYQNAEITFAPSGPSVTSASNVVKSATMSLGSNHHDNEKDAPHHHGNEKDAPFHHGNEKDAPYHHGNEKDAPYHHGNEKDANHHGNEKDAHHHGNEKDAPYGNRDPDTRGFTVPSVYVQTESSSAGEISRGGVEGERPAQLNLVPEIVTSSPRNKSPVTVQEWVDSLPLETPPRVEEEPISPIVNIDHDQEHDTLTLGAEATFMCQNVSGGAACASPGAISVNNVPANCEVSDAGSHDSVDSFLEARKADPETILLNLGFGGSISNSSYSDTGRIPQRFLQPSKLNGIAIENFLKHQQLLVHSYESGLGGYRGLTGSAQTKSCIVQKIMEKLLDYERETSSLGSPSDSGLPTAKSLPPNGKVGTGAASPGTNRFSNAARNVLTKIKCVPPSSVLSPDNRKWLESQGDKSPEVARRMILGQTSYIFGQDGDLIESPASSCIGENDRALPRTLKTQGGPPHTSSSNHSSPNNSTLTSSSLSSPNLQSHNHTHSHNHHDRSHNHHSNNHHHGSYKEPLEFHPDHDRSRRPFTPSVTSNSTSNLTNSTSSDYEGPQISSSDRFYKSVLQISHLNNIKFSMEYEDDVFARENSEVGDGGRIGEAHRRGFEEAHRSASESGSESGNRRFGEEHRSVSQSGSEGGNRRFGEVQSGNGSQSEGSGRRFKESNMRSVSESGSEASGRRFGEAHSLSGNSESGDERGGYILLNIDRRGEELSKSTETIVANGDSQGDGNNEAGVNNERTSVNNREVSLNKKEVSVTNEEVSINNARAGVNMDANGNLSVGTVNSVNTADNGNINGTTNDVLNRNNNRPDNPQNANGGFERSSSTTEVLGQESTDGVRQRPSIVINHCESIDMNAETADRTDANEQTYNGKARVAGSSEQDGNANTEGNDSQGNELGTNETQELNYRHNINTSEINPVPETSIEQSTLIRGIKKIDDNQNIVDNPPIGENKEATAARVGPSSSMADLVYNLIVDKSDAIEPNVDNKTDSQNQLLNEIEIKTKPSDIEEDIVQRKNSSEERTNYDAAYETAHANIVVVSRNMKNIDDMNSKEHSDKMEKIASSVKDTRCEKEIVEAQNTASDQLGNIENGSSVKESAPDKIPSGSSIADFVYNMIVKSTGPSSSADQTNEENSSTNPRIVLDTSDEVDKDDTRNERSISSNACDSGEASNTEAVNVNETSNVDEASHAKPANHLNLASIMPSPLVTQIKRTSSAVSLRDELLESLGSIEHEKSPDLDDLLASIGPIRVENDEDYDEIYESDFEENQEIPVLRKQKKHQYRKKHADSHGSGLVDGHQCDGAKRRRTTDEVESDNEDAKSDKEDSCHVCPTCRQRNQHYYNDPESIDRAFSPVNVDDDYVRGKRCCRMNHDSLATETHEPGGHEECRNCHRSDPNTDADISECCRTCYRPSIDYSMLDESCHIPVIKSIDKIITTLENVLEPLEQITDSATESEISCGYKRRGSGKSAGTAGPGHVENLNLLIAKLNHINGTELSSIAAGDFSALSNHEQCSLQCKILRQALATYLSQMSQQELHEELKSCLSLEVERVAELLNGNIDVGVLSRVVLQMTSLLHHQYQLNEQIRDLTHPSPSENNAPPASCCHSNPGVCCHGNDASFPSNAQSDALCCHGDRSECCHSNRGLCCHSNILKRVQNLEQQVRRNARELEDMKRKLEEKLL